jgi:methylmalonyl-CoA mutase N-terminal domain/subunit
MKMIEDLAKSIETWESSVLKESLAAKAEQQPKFMTDSGITVKRVYTPLDMEEQDFSFIKDVGFPGDYPFTRGISPTMYRGDLWVMSQYSGFGSAEETHEWYKYLLDKGATGLSMALDLPTQLGYDSDHALAQGEVGQCGVALNSLRDMEIIFDGIPLNKINLLATTANSMGPVFLAWAIALAEKQGIRPQDFRLRLQNDVLKEYVARGTQIFPPKPGLKFSGDVIEYVVKQGMGNVYPLTVSGYHMREAGATAPQELAFTLANAASYIEEVLGRGINIDDFGGNIWLFLGIGIDFFEEIAKLRACRRMWAKMMKERFGARKNQSMMARYHSFTQGSAFTAQQPINNIARGAIMGLAGVIGGVQSMTISSFDEALGLPTEESARVELRTQQIIAHESGVTRTVDPMAGSYFVENLTSEIEKAANDYMERIKVMGGAVVAIEKAYFQREITEAAYKWQKKVASGDRVVVGINSYQMEEPISIKIRKINPEIQDEQVKKIKVLKRERDNTEVKRRLHEVSEDARKNQNTIPSIIGAVKAYATIGEICSELREVWGEYKEQGLTM